MSRADDANAFIEWDDERVTLRIAGSADRFYWNELESVVAACRPAVLLLHLPDRSLALPSWVTEFDEFCEKLCGLQGFDRDAFHDVLANAEKTRAICWERPTLSDSFLRRSPPPYTELVQAVFAEDPVAVERLVSSGADANQRWAGCPVLILAIQDNDTDHVVQVLLNHGANVNLTGTSGDTPLHNAVTEAIERAMNDELAIDLSLVQLLLRHGADLTIKNARDESPSKLLIVTGLSRANSSIYLLNWGTLGCRPNSGCSTRGISQPSLRARLRCSVRCVER